MTKQPHLEEFKIKAVKQITERGHRVSEDSEQKSRCAATPRVGEQ